ncbi:MAG: type II toxin-antitoxin system RelE/ParE family toxin [Burkholderiales bacterium]
MRKADKPLVWLHGEVRTPPFSAEARIEAGVLLRNLQRGETIPLPHSRPMPSVGKACHELRIQDANRTWRIIYCIDAEAIVILEVIAKTTQQTPHSVIETCRARLKRYFSI